MAENKPYSAPVYAISQIKHTGAPEWAAPVMVINHPSSKKDSYSVAKVDISRYLCEYKNYNANKPLMGMCLVWHIPFFCTLIKTQNK